MGYRSNRVFKDETQITKNQLKKCSIFLVISEMLIKIPLWFHLTSVRIAEINITSPWWLEFGVRAILIYCWLEYKITYPLLKFMWQFLTKLGLDLPQDAAIYSINFTSYYKDTCLSMFIVVLFIIAICETA